MKKALSLILALVMCLSLCACTGKTNEIKLTLDNYDDYLSLTYWTTFRDKWETRNVLKLTGGDWTKTFYATVGGWGKAEATTSNFNFNNVKVTLRVKGSTVAMEKFPPYGLTGDEVTETFDLLVTIDTDIAGNGEGETLYTLPNNLVTDNRAMTGTNYGDSLWCTIEVVEVQGSVTPA